MRNFLYALSFALVFSACSSLNSMYIEQLEPSDVSYPSKIKRVGVVNNILPDMSYQVPDTTLNTKIFVPNGVLAAQTFASELADVQYFDEIVLNDSSYFTSDQQQPKFLSPELATQVIHDLDVDMLITLDSSIGAFYYDTNLALPSSYLSGAAVVYVTTHVYLPDRKQVFHAFTDKDTLVWENDFQLTDQSIGNDVLLYASRMPLKHFVPQWERMERYYYNGRNSDIRDGAVCAQSNDWGGACAAWLRSYNKTNGKGQMESAFNLALGYEMQDNITEALKWLEKSKQIEGAKQKKDVSGKVLNPSQAYSLLEYYQKCLQKKEADLFKVKMQMERFNDKN